jgi:2-polyprenyl-3-methyl-5-hydroxy-6-metoxy-1,4-benzoquinol methylase
LARGVRLLTTSARRRHWEAIYGAKPEEELSWHQEHPTISLGLIRSVATKNDRVVDIGGGSSNLASELLRGGFESMSVLDISRNAVSRNRSGAAGGVGRIRYRVGDVTRVRTLGRYEVWHDRAAFHFLTDPKDRRQYVDLAAKTVPVGGHLVIATFAPTGPEQCSGLPVERYDAARLTREFGDRFVLVDSRTENHRTPWGAIQAFTYVVLRRVRRRSAIGTAELAEE